MPLPNDHSLRSKLQKGKLTFIGIFKFQLLTFLMAKALIVQKTGAVCSTAEVTSG